MLATDKSRYFAQPRPIIVYCFTYISIFCVNTQIFVVARSIKLPNQIKYPHAMTYIQNFRLDFVSLTTSTLKNSSLIEHTFL